MNVVKLSIISTTLLVASTFAIPASAVSDFATFSSLSGGEDFQLVNSGNSSTRMNDAVITNGEPLLGGLTSPRLVRFSFQDPVLSPYFTNVSAAFKANVSIQNNSPAIVVPGFGIVQKNISGKFTFLSTARYQLPTLKNGPYGYLGADNLLTVDFTDLLIFGSGSTVTASKASINGSNVVFSSDFLDFSNTSEESFQLMFASVAPLLSIHTGANGALNSFKANVSGTFTSGVAPLLFPAYYAAARPSDPIIPDPPPTPDPVSDVPEPSTWALMLLGFGLIGYVVRKQLKQGTAVSYT